MKVDLEIFYSSLLKRDPRYVTSGAERMLVDVIGAVLHVVLKTSVGTTKILAVSVCLEALLELFSRSVF